MTNIGEGPTNLNADGDIERTQEEHDAAMAKYACVLIQDAIKQLVSILPDLRPAASAKTSIAIGHLFDAHHALDAETDLSMEYQATEEGSADI